MLSVCGVHGNVGGDCLKRWLQNMDLHLSGGEQIRETWVVELSIVVGKILLSELEARDTERENERFYLLITSLECFQHYWSQARPKLRAENLVHTVHTFHVGGRASSTGLSPAGFPCAHQWKLGSRVGIRDVASQAVLTIRLNAHPCSLVLCHLSGT